MVTALVLGANGFVGQWLARELREHGYRVCASDVQPKPSTWLVCDFYQSSNLLEVDTLAHLFEVTQPNQVYNLAAVSSVGQSWRNPALTMRVNVEGTVNLLEVCRTMDSKPKVLLVGSSEEYAPSGEPLSEDSPLAATNPYGISKEAQGRIADMYFREYNLPVYRVRAFNHTGPGQASAFVLPSWCRQTAEIERSGQPGSIRVGNLEVSRDFSDVRDVVRAYRMLMESDCAGEVFNVGNGISRPLRELLDLIISFCSQEVTVEVDPVLLRPADNPVISCDASRIESALGWKPSFPIESTLYDLFSSFLMCE